MSTFRDSRFSRREWIRRAAGTAGAVGVAASVSERSGAVPAAQGESQTIRLYSLAWQPDCVKAMQAAVENWNTANQDRFQVEYIQGDWGNARDYLTTSLSAGVAPDIIHGITPWSMEYGLQGAYADITDRINASDLATDLHPLALDAARSPISDRYYGVPFSWEVGMIFINADRFAEQGIAIPEQGWTWDEFLDAARKVNDPANYYALAANLGATEDIIPWIWQTGAEVLGEFEGEWRIDIDKGRPALQLWHDMLHKEQLVSPNSFGGFELEVFAIEAFSMYQTGCFARGTILEAEPAFAWRMVPLPHEARHASGSQPQTWSMATTTEEQGRGDAAWEVIEWFMNAENMSAIAKGDWLFPTRQSILEDPEFSTTDNDWNIANSELQYAHAYPRHPAWVEIDERVLVPNFQRFLQDQMSLDDLIALVNDQGEQILAKYE
jgi:multiple sugar transport system substrate-binding protein